VKNAEAALRRTIEHQILNEYRGRDQRPELGVPVMFSKADSPLGRSFHEFARALDKAPRPVAGSAVVATPR